MINKDSIVTAYDEHLTLVEWLQKVENALNNAVLTNLGIAKLSDKNNVATYQVTASFADNTTIVSDTFTLPSTNIVTAFNSLTTLVNGFDTRITANTNNVASILRLIDIDNAKINPDTLQNSINGSDDVIVDVDNDKLEIHLSDELQAKLARVLLMPSSAPNTRKVVTIDTNGAQDNVDPTELTTLMTNIVDSHGNPRFVEGNLSIVPENTAITKIYGKWSLSGTHLLLVFCFTHLATHTLTNGAWMAKTDSIPSYIMNKILPISDNIVGVFSYYRGASNTSSYVALLKSGSTLAISYYGNSYTPVVDEISRIQIDLLIDRE